MQNFIFYILFIFLTPKGFGIVAIFMDRITKFHWNTVINTNVIICIITKKCYTPNENIVYILEKGIHFELKVEICLHEINATGIYTSFRHSNKQIMLSLY